MRICRAFLMIYICIFCTDLLRLYLQVGPDQSLTFSVCAASCKISSSQHVDDVVITAVSAVANSSAAMFSGTRFGSFSHNSFRFSLTSLKKVKEKEKGSCAEFVAVDVFQFKSDSVKPFSCIRIKVIIIIIIVIDIYRGKFLNAFKTSWKFCFTDNKDRQFIANDTGSCQTSNPDFAVFTT